MCTICNRKKYTKCAQEFYAHFVIKIVDKRAQKVYFIYASTNSAQLKEAAMSTGEKLKELRGAKTQAAAAKDIGITKSALAMYERNERVPRDEAKVMIANYYGVSIQDLFFNSTEHK